MSALHDALRQFEATEANLGKLETLWEQIRLMIRDETGSVSEDDYEARSFAFRQILERIPAIDGYRMADEVPTLQAIAAMRHDAAEIGDAEATADFERSFLAQEPLLREYRLRFQAKRKELVRDRMLTLVDAVDGLLRELTVRTNPEATRVSWERLNSSIAEIETLLGSASRPRRWSDLRRHLHFATEQDLEDIQRLDWPGVKPGLLKDLYGQNDPLPIDVDDLGAVVASKPKGAVPTQLNWPALSDEDFERLLFVLIADTPGYENPEWLQRTNAADRGRDLSVVRIESDPLVGTRRHRTIIQCKHWLSKSVSATDVGQLRTQMELWEPPRVDNLIIATSGRFTMDAVDLVEAHNRANNALTISMWPESHLERLLASRPHLIAQFRLRA